MSPTTTSASSHQPTKLWAKGYALEPAIERYEAARNAALDAELARHDLWGTMAHAHMLQHIGILSPAEWTTLHAALRDLLDAAEAGALQPSAAEEDIHTTIENALVAQVGAAGKKIHTGRSRNDQVLVDLRLYTKEALLATAHATLDTASALADLAHAHEWTPMPGYTHMQRAMLSSVGLWAASYAEALLDDCALLASVYALNDQSPLGSAAAYGVPLPLDRAHVAKLLGFARVQHNVLTAANARGKFEAATLQALALVMLDLSKFAQDILLFTTSEFGFFTVPASLCAGSSIMPQKRNHDALELLRARAHTITALQTQVLTTLAGLPSGYNMDYQETKAPLIEALHLCHESLEVARLYAQHLTPNVERLTAACTAELFATDRAYELSLSGTPFRDAYRFVAEDPTAQQTGDLAARLATRTSEGTPGNLGLAHLDARIAEVRATWDERQEQFQSAITRLVHLNKPAEIASQDEPQPATITHGSGTTSRITSAGSVFGGTGTVALGI